MTKILSYNTWFLGEYSGAFHFKLIIEVNVTVFEILTTYLLRTVEFGLKTHFGQSGLGTDFFFTLERPRRCNPIKSVKYSKIINETILFHLDVTSCGCEPIDPKILRGGGT